MFIMDKIKLLEIKKLFKELDYVQSDFEYRSEIISEADTEFINSVNCFLDGEPELKELYESKVTEIINQNIIINSYEPSLEQTEKTENDFEEPEIFVDDKSPKVKKLYREIVKLTHPDKSDKKSHNDIYVKATEYYDMNDKISLYKICNELDIDYDVDSEDNIEIQTRIETFKGRINFLETTFTYQWHKMNDETMKNEMMIGYIKMRVQ
jgi:hypothetical protein